ncbi:hypothetical protein IGI37_002721 [Enterococcus sp. AZ194]|uniref:hypothetical protein n=1 Tax=Enterococcus sp. AZ194 TaxID=2774629 RepID=UPI003F259112
MGKKINHLTAHQQLRHVPYYIGTSLLTFMCFLFFFKESTASEFSLGDILGYISLGINPITAFDPSQVFKLPLLWVSLYIYLLFVLLRISLSFSSTYDYWMLFVLKKRVTYWCYQVQLTCSTIIGHFCLIVLTATLCTFVMGGNLSIEPTKQFLHIFLHRHIPVSGTYFFIQAIVFPLLVCFVVGLLEVTLMYFFYASISYLLCIGYLILSTFFTSPLFLGNYLMLLKTRIAAGEGVSNGVGLLMIICSFIGLFIVGMKKVEHWDYLN